MYSRVSFIVLSDGPCNSSSFRPLEDNSQWWGRRDALTRILTASITQSSPIAYIFHDGNEKKKKNKEIETSSSSSSLSTLGIAFISSPSLVLNEIKVPTEKNIIKIIKEGFQICEKTKKNDRKEYNNLIDCNLVSMNITSSNSSSASSLLSATSFINKDKKEILEYLQSNLSFHYLKENGLNISSQLVLKKFNKEKLLNILTKYENEFKNESSELISNTNHNQYENLLKDNFKQILLKIINNKNPLDNKTSSFFNNKRSYSSLEFDKNEEILIKKDLNNNKIIKINKENNNNNEEVDDEEIILLLLHEDYSNELPVFGFDSEENNKKKKQHIICLLGGVRDITDLETKIFLQLGEEFKLKIIGVNLGRTAEFTSKIITSMTSHCLSGHLFLPPSFSSSLYEKLDPIRLNNTRWNGYENKRSIENEFSKINNIKESKQLFEQDEHLVVIKYLDFLPSFLNNTLESREKFYPLIQLVVNTCWKSRVSSDHQFLEDNSTRANYTLENSLYLIFSDSSMICLDKKILLKEVEEFHISAPSENQIIEMLVRLVNNKENIISNSFPIDQVRLIFSKHIKNKKEANYYILYPPNQQNDHKLSINIKSSLNSLIYKKKCLCSQNIDNLDGSKKCSFLFLGNLDFLFKSKDYSLIEIELYKILHDSDPLNDLNSKLTKRMEKIKSKIIQSSIYSVETASSLPIYSHYIVALLQHWAYHGLLFSSLKEYCKKFN